MTEPPPELDAALALADWRRVIAELHAEVRVLARTDPGVARDRWAEVRERLFREHPMSPLPAAERAGFRARYWPYDPALRFAVPVVPAGPGRPRPDGVPRHPGGILLDASAGAPIAAAELGTVELALPGGARQLALLWLPGYAGGLFLPFRDATNGATTYAAGRYLLDTAKGADLGSTATGALVIDLNFAYHPSCAFDPRWACPLASAGNRIDLAIEAGERLR